MNAKNAVPSAVTPTIKRFVRLLSGEAVAVLAKKVWDTPQFTAREVHGVTQFVFSIKLRDRIRSYDEDAYRILFKSKGPAWKESLNNVYLTAHSGKKTAAEYIDTSLYTIFREALKVLMRDSNRIGPKHDEPYRGIFEQNVENGVKDFALKSDRKRGRKRTRQVDETRPIRLARRHETLIPLVLTLKRFLDDLKGRGVQDESALFAEVSKTYQGQEWIAHVLSGEAFQDLPPGSGEMASAQSSLGGEWAAWQLTVGIIRCEESPHRGRPIGAVTIARLIKRGKELIENPKLPRN